MSEDNHSSFWTNASLAGLGIVIIASLPYHFTRGPTKLNIFLGLSFVFASAKFWHSQVTKAVPEPYLDEVFHIPQAQAYCEGQYRTWDPKLTTPPGLYAFAVLTLNVFRGVCSVEGLRQFNVFALLSLTTYVVDIRSILTSRTALRSGKMAAITPEAVHTAVNIALFPPLFFFSGLFYTDVLSTRFVLEVYRMFLIRKGVDKNSGEGLVMNYVIGIFALTMRQTNIFWVAIYLGGLEAVRAIKMNVVPEGNTEKSSGAEPDPLMTEIRKWGRGSIHDVALEDANLIDFALMPISLAVAVLHQPKLILARLWPYIALLVSFLAFVYINGGVVLGDKSNHVATLHLPQMLYLFPFLTFFSLPTILPPFIQHTLATLKSMVSSPPTTKPTTKPATTTTDPTTPNSTATSTSTIPRPLLLILSFLTVLTLLMATIAIIYFNTIIHPFTLADNRHYMFYVFRYTILRHPAIRYLLAPIYLGCGWAVYLSLCPTTKPSSQPSKPTTDTPPSPTVSTVILLLIPTTLSLITAPLVEPRYFILPWLFYRLHLPASQPRKWLWAETLWFIAINAGTGYMFLYRGFEWKQEAGKVQRFMW